MFCVLCIQVCYVSKLRSRQRFGNTLLVSYIFKRSLQTPLITKKRKIKNLRSQEIIIIRLSRHVSYVDGWSTDVDGYRTADNLVHGC